MQTKFFAFMFTIFAATCCFSCSSGDSDEDSIENNAVEDNLPTETKGSSEISRDAVVV